MSSLECPLCFEQYRTVEECRDQQQQAVGAVSVGAASSMQHQEEEEDSLLPIKIMCCGLTMCRGCLRRAIATTSKCPWEKTRWISRTAYKKCEDCTPTDYLTSLRLAASADGGANCYKSPQKGVLGDGELGKEYARVVELRQKLSAEEDAERIQEDVRFAAELTAREQEDERQRLLRQLETDAKDAELALQFASGLSPLPVSETKPGHSSLKRSRAEIVGELDGAAEISSKAPKRLMKKLAPPAAAAVGVGLSAWLTRPAPSTPATDREVSSSKSPAIIIALDDEASPQSQSALSCNGQSQSSGVTDPRGEEIQAEVTPPRQPVLDGNWPCHICTFENHVDLLECEICLTKRLLHSTRSNSSNQKSHPHSHPM